MIKKDWNLQTSFMLENKPLYQQYTKLRVDGHDKVGNKILENFSSDISFYMLFCINIIFSGSDY